MGLHYKGHRHQVPPAWDQPFCLLAYFLNPRFRSASSIPSRLMSWILHRSLKAASRKLS
jgi:hypothetical protein